MDDVLSHMVKEFPAETLRLIFSDNSGQLDIEKAEKELNTPRQFIKKWIKDNKLPSNAFPKVRGMYENYLKQTVEKLRKDASEKIRIRKF